MNPTERFTSRVEDYVKHRPSYPATVLNLLEQRCGLKHGSRVADVGSGTGILTKLLLARGATVIGVEPNMAMRNAAEAALGDNDRFISSDARAESTGIQKTSIDLYVASQAFHWFEAVAARQECLRILKPGCWAALIWNERHECGSPFLEAYEALLTSLPAYHETRRQALPEQAIVDFLSPGPIETKSFLNSQTLDWDGLAGRAASSSYFPKAGDAEYRAAMQELARIFDEHAETGTVELLYDCQIFLAQPDLQVG